jgi:quercetin dioxygenase-like cupin family protein
MMKHLRHGLPLLVVAIVAVGLAVGVVSAAQPARPVATTVATGTLPTPAHTVIVAQGEMGTIAGVADVREVRVVKFELAPGGAFPWHQHPGPVWALVTRGTLTYYSAACEAHAYPAGSAFLDPGNVTHTARNEGDEQVEVIATFMFPAGAEAASVPHPAPVSCPIEA